MTRIPTDQVDRQGVNGLLGRAEEASSVLPVPPARVSARDACEGSRTKVAAADAG